MDPRDYKLLLRHTVLLPAVLMAALAVILLLQVNSLARRMRSVQHSDEIASTSRQFLRAALDMETGLRGYLLTGDRKFLDPFQSGEPLADESLAALRQLTAGDPSANRNVEELRDRFENWREHARVVLANPPAHGTSGELQELIEGKRRMDAVRQARDTLLNEIEAERAKRSSSLRFQTRTTLVMFTLLCASVAVAIAVVTHRRMSALLDHYTVLLALERARTNEVQEAREWLLTTLRSIGDGVVSTDEQGRIAFMNAVAEQITGWGHLDATGAQLTDVLRIEELDTHKPITDLLETAKSLDSPIPVKETLLHRKDGTTITVDQSVAPIPNSNGDLSGVVIVMRDTTERHRSEAALRASERLAVLGRLSATIAHEIRNPLEAVTNILYLMRSASLDSDAKTYLNVADEEVRRISQTTNQLLGFTREVRSPVEVDLKVILDGVLNLFAPKIQGAKIAVKRDYRGSAVVVGLPGELRQVFSNLIANAIDAQPAGGGITVRIAPDRDWSDSMHPGVRVLVSDTGPGIPESVEPSLFNAFFTTKGEKGTGLGLWVSRGIVTKHGGAIRVRSRTEGPHRGTTFSIFLPTQNVESRQKVAL